MSSHIIYPNGSGGVCLVTPTGEMPVGEVARKDVPAGVPYLILDGSQVPPDHTFFSAWEADFNSPHGIGIGANAWFAEQASKEVTQ